VTPERPLRLHRTLIVSAGGAYLAWWGFVRASLPDAYNPFAGRLAVVACFFAVWAASYRSVAVARRLETWLAVLCALATAHYYYLFDRNHADLNWVVGSYITVTAVCAILQSARALLLYSLFVAALSIAILVRQPGRVFAVFLPGMLTSLLFANIGMRVRLRLLAERERAEALLLRANKDLESFSYSVAHDLRAPLRAMSGFSRILLEDYGDKVDEEGKRHLTRVSAQAEHMGRLVDALLGLSRFTRKELQREEVNLTQHAEEVAAELRTRHPSVVVAFVAQPGMIASCDPQLVRAVLENLLANAWKFSERKPEPRVSFACTVKDGRRVYVVEDNGVGFAMAYVDKLFAPFHRLHNASEYPGTGIGLATVQRVVERHGGRAWAEGVVNEGAKFYFTLD